MCRGETSWPVRLLVDGTPDLENVTDALRTGPYGKCVYESDNDVCDYQVRTSLLIYCESDSRRSTFLGG